MKIIITDVETHIVEKRNLPLFRKREVRLNFSIGEALLNKRFKKAGTLISACTGRDIASFGVMRSIITVPISVAVTHTPKVASAPTANPPIFGR